jgi:hypothetical protein
MGGAKGGTSPPPPLEDILGGTIGGVNPSIPPRSPRSGNSVHSRGGLLPPGEFLTQVPEVILCISPAAGFVRFGYIYLYENERHQEDAITAYFDSAGREVLAIPCPDFNAFMVTNHLSNHDIVFLMDLPRHVILAGIRILQANCYNNSPNLDWMPAPPNTSSFGASRDSSSRRSLFSSQPLLSSQTSSSSQIRARGDGGGSRYCQPDPEGIGFNQAPRHSSIPDTVFMFFFMGGSITSQGGISSMTIHKLRKIGGIQSPPLLESSSHSVVFKPAPLPLSLGTVILVRDESTAPPSPAPPPPAPLVTSIKDKPSDMGLKYITDKNSWIKAKAVIDSCLRCTPF